MSPSSSWLVMAMSPVMSVSSVSGSATGSKGLGVVRVVYRWEGGMQGGWRSVAGHRERVARTYHVNGSWMRAGAHAGGSH